MKIYQRPHFTQLYPTSPYFLCTLGLSVTFISPFGFIAAGHGVARSIGGITAPGSTLKSNL
jgi:hypothetical protein